MNTHREASERNALKAPLGHIICARLRAPFLHLDAARGGNMQNINAAMCCLEVERVQ
jgi:hypothetical protein